MSVDHEYSVIGHNRTVIGRYLGTVAGALAAASSLAAAAFFDWFGETGIGAHVPNMVTWPVTATLVFGAVHWLFNRLIWRWSLVRSLIGVPDLNGTWTVAGQTMNPVQGVSPNWSGEIVIRQNWEKIWVHLRTGQSASRSKAAALLHEPGAGYVLMYSYRNEPRIGEPLSPHVGYAELTFDEALSSAEGEYFNSKGRVTFGRMALTKKD